MSLSPPAEIEATGVPEMTGVATLAADPSELDNTNNENTMAASRRLRNIASVLAMAQLGQSGASATDDVYQVASVAN
jgi:hypothetical protein